MHLRCPQCHEQFEIVAEQDFSEICCPECGSTFSLLSGETVDLRRSPGELVHFELIDRLGAGQFGVVWKVRDTQLDRIVAMKVPRRGQLTSEETEFFFRDARAAAQLRHPNIVAVHEVGRNDQSVFIVTDYIEGADLKEWITGQRITSREAAELMVLIADAVQHAHEHGVIHRDLKPSNVLMDMNGRPHVTDFGLAKRETGEMTMTMDGQVVGTPAYMSPEQAQGKGHHADARSDVYSLGVILYQLLTGELPFRGESRMLIVQIMRDEPPPPRKLNARIPRDMETIALRCLQKDPARRYQSSKELADDLRRYLAGEPIHARPIGRVVRGWRWCKRKPAIATLVAAVGILLGIGVIAAGLVAVRETSLRRLADDAAAKASEQERTALSNLYAARMNLADQHLRAGRPGRAIKLLESVKRQNGNADNRGFEWYYLWQQCHPGLVYSIIAHPGGVRSLAFSPDSHMLATAGADENIKLWRASTGTRIKMLQGHTAGTGVNSITFSPNGLTLASGGTDGSVRLWNVTSASAEIICQSDDRDVLSLAFSPVSNTLAIVDGAKGSSQHTPNGKIRLWNLVGHRITATYAQDQGASTQLAYSPDGKLLGQAGGLSRVQLLDVNTGNTWLSLPRDWISSGSIAFSPTGTELAVGTGSGKIRLWDLNLKKEQVAMNSDSVPVNAITYAIDGELLASGSEDGNLRIWNPRLKTAHAGGHISSIESIAFSTDGQFLASGDSGGTVKVWSKSWKPAPVSAPREGINVWAVAYSPDGATVASCVHSEHAIDLWDVAAQRIRQRLVGHSKKPTALQFSPDGTRLASTGDDSLVLIWDLSTGQPLVKQRHHATEQTNDPIAHGHAVAFSPDGQLLASAGNDGVVKLWDARAGQAKGSLLGHAGWVWSLAFSPDNQTLASASWDGTIRLWDLDSRQERIRLECHCTWSQRLTFSPDGKSLAAFDDRSQLVRLWDMGTGKKTKEFGKSDLASSSCLAFSPDFRVAAMGRDDGSITFWDVETGQERATLVGSPRAIFAITFSPNGQSLAFGTWEGAVHFWDAASEQQVVEKSGASDNGAN